MRRWKTRPPALNYGSPNTCLDDLEKESGAKNSFDAQMLALVIPRCDPLYPVIEYRVSPFLSFACVYLTRFSCFLTQVELATTGARLVHGNGATAIFAFSDPCLLMLHSHTCMIHFPLDLSPTGSEEASPFRLLECDSPGGDGIIADDSKAVQQAPPPKTSKPVASLLFRFGTIRNNRLPG